MEVEWRWKWRKRVFERTLLYLIWGNYPVCLQRSFDLMWREVEDEAVLHSSTEPPPVLTEHIKAILFAQLMVHSHHSDHFLNH